MYTFLLGINAFSKDPFDLYIKPNGYYNSGSQ